MVKNMNRGRRSSAGASGQALIEACLIMALLCLILFGVFQVSQLFAAREVLDYAATAGARARTVGFNDFMIYKVVRTASIPNAGQMTTPEFENVSFPPGYWRDTPVGELWDAAMVAAPRSGQAEIERSRIPLYLGAEGHGQLPAILEYDEWDTIRTSGISEFGDQIRARVRQDFPLRVPFHAAFYAADDVLMEGEARLESHYSLYLE